MASAFFTVVFVAASFGWSIVCSLKLQGKVHIIGGREAAVNEYPWMVTIQISVPGKTPQTCGGALISVFNDEKSDIVLTAAHCIADYKCPTHEHQCGWKYKRAASVTVIAGNHNLKQTDEAEAGTAVAAMEHHPDWNKVNMTACLEDELPASACHTNDVAIVKVFDGFKFTKAIKAINLPSQDEHIANPNNCTVAGWGLSTEIDENDENAQKRMKPSNELRAIDVNVQDVDECAMSYKEKPQKFENLLCAVAGRQNGTSCAGDSGGPLWCKGTDGEPTVYGVVSGSSGYCGVSQIGVYVNVAKFADWIQETIERLTTIKSSKTVY